METKMRHLLLKTCVAGACALAFVAAYGPAKAMSPLSLDEVPALFVPVVDQEDLSVEEDLRPDEPPEAMMGEKPEGSMMDTPPEEPAGEGAGDMEDEMIDKIGPGAE
jgi:hypothetical protein